MRCDVTDARETTLLHVACEDGMSDAVRWMLERRLCAPENLDLCNAEGWPALFCTVRGGDGEEHLQTADLLISHGADINYEVDDAADAGDQTALGAALVFEHTNMLNLLLDRGANHQRDAAFSSNEDSTLLHFACHLGYLDGVITLVSAGVSINADSESESQSPLYYAIRAHKNEYEIARFLLENGADCSGNDASVIYDVCRFGDVRMLALLLKHGARPDASCLLAVSDGPDPETSVEKALYLLERVSHLNANTANGYGLTFLMASCKVHNHRLASVLLNELGAKVDATDIESRTALVHAVKQTIPDRYHRRHEARTLRVLMAHNASVHVTWHTSSSNQAFYPVEYEIMKGNYTCAELLIRFSNDRRWVEHVTTEELRSNTNSDAVTFCSFVDDVLSRVDSLQDLCRKRVRETLGGNLVRDAASLPLPESVRDYILVPELQSDACINEYP